ncbi:MAG: type III-A CRISPR-associated RAMP protein Csm5 [Candidatus Omnitrophota bacterium]
MDKQYKITLLSPVHIGSGEKFCKDIDYFSDEKKGTFLIDLEKFFETLSVSQINTLTNSENVISFMDREGINKWDFIKKKINYQKVHASEIIRHIKDCFERPYIPGSSLKGALRTVIAQHIFKEENLPFECTGNRKEWAYKEMSEKIFGKDHNHDFLKGFIVVDAPFNGSDLALHLTKVFTLQRDRGLSVKLRQKDNPRSEMQIYGEFLKEKASSQVKTKIDDFFFKPSVMEKLDKINQNRKNALLNIREIANKYARERIQDELTFYSGQKDLEPISRFYQDLLNRMEACKGNGFLLNIGWGTGWNFKTGNWINEKNLDEVRRTFRIGKMIKRCPSNHEGKDLEFRSGGKFYCTRCQKEYDENKHSKPFKPFPKSRKILFDRFDRNGKPFSIPGWVMLTEV